MSSHITVDISMEWVQLTTSTPGARIRLNSDQTTTLINALEEALTYISEHNEPRWHVDVDYFARV